MPFPQLRSDIVLEPRYVPGLHGDTLHYLALDPTTGLRLWLTAHEGHIMRALQQLRGNAGSEAITGFIQLHFEVAVSEADVTAILERLARLQWLATESSTDAIVAQCGITLRTDRDTDALLRLRASVRRMREEVPYYRDLFRQNNLSEDALRSLDDLTAFPRLTKTQFREHFDRLHPESITEHKAWWGDLVWRSSSGSSGPRTQTIACADNYAYTLFETLGSLAPGETSRQCLFIPPACTGATCHMETAIPYEKRVMFGNTLLMNAVRNACTASDAAMEEYVREIDRFKPRGLMGAGSLIYPLARYLKRTNRQPPKIDFIHLHVEVCSRIHQRLIEEVFECPAHGCYVSSEMGFAAVQCPRGSYHPGPGFLLEILTAGHPAKPGQIGRLCATTLTTHNRLTPLLRYELGDLATAAPGPCACSPRYGPIAIASIEGRIAEAFRNRDGNLITPRSVDNVVSTEPCCQNIAFYSLIQETEDRYQLDVVPADGEADIATDELTTALRGLLGDDAQIAIRLRDEILPTQPAGRYRLCYSKLPSDLETSI